MLDAVKGALQVMSGVTEVTVSRARDVAAALISQGLGSDAVGVVGDVQELADDLMTTGRDNRGMLLQLVRMEVDRAVNRMGFVREDELASLRRHVDRLEAALAAATASSQIPATSASKATPTESTPTKTTATQATVKKATVKKATVKSATAGRAAAKKASANAKDE